MFLLAEDILLVSECYFLNSLHISFSKILYNCLFMSSKRFCTSGRLFKWTFKFLDIALVVRKNGFCNGRGLVLCLCIGRVIDLIIVIVHNTQ